MRLDIFFAVALCVAVAEPTDRATKLANFIDCGIL